jgi:hypothetical protein
MASVDITELIPSLEAALTIPGQTSPYSSATESEWTLKLTNAFWRAVLDGIITGFVIDEDGIIAPESGTETLSRSYQQIVVIYAAMNIVQNTLLQLKTTFRAKAGPVEYETQQASQVLTTLLKTYENEKNLILSRLSDVGSSDESYYYDMPWERRDSQHSGLAYWVGN